MFNYLENNLKLIFKKKFIVITVFIAILAISALTTYFVSEAARSENNKVFNLTETSPSNGRFIVKYKDNVDKNKVRAKFKSKLNIKENKSLRVRVRGANKKLVNSNSAEIWTLDKDTKIQDVENIEKQVDTTNEIESIQPDYVMSTSDIQVNDKFYEFQWGHNSETKVDAQVKPAWSKSMGSNVIVAVLDTAMDINHEDLKDNIYTNTGEIPNNNIDDDNNGYIDDVHGYNFTGSPDNQYDMQHATHVAGIIAAEKNDKGVVGVAPEAKIMPLTVFNNGVAYTSDIINAIQYAENNGAKIVNCSWGSTYNNPLLEQAIENSNMLFICAAGNSGKNVDVVPADESSTVEKFYPACLDSDNVISVGAIRKDGNISALSNYGATSVDVMAPGETVLSTLPNNKYDMKNGTSMAAAFVSGEAALILSNQTATAAAIKERILSTVQKINTLDGKVASGGMINCEYALDNKTDAEAMTVKVLVNPNVQPEATNTTSPADERYKLAAGAWLGESDMNAQRVYSSSVQVNGKIYTFGGNNITNQIYSEAASAKGLEVYTPSSNTWETKWSDMLIGSYTGVATLNNKIYVSGGTLYQKQFKEYNPASNSWNTLPDLPYNAYMHSLVALNNKLYLIGADGSLNGKSTYEYNFDTQTWTKKADMQYGRKYGKAIADDKYIYIFGGTDTATGQVLNTAEKYNPATNVWSRISDMPISGNLCAITKAYDLFYFNSGYTLYQYNSGMDSYDGVSVNDTNYRWHFGLVTIGYDQIYAVSGGAADTGISKTEMCTITNESDFFEYNPQTISEYPVYNAVRISHANSNYFIKIKTGADGTYIFETTGEVSTTGYLYDENYNCLKTDNVVEQTPPDNGGSTAEPDPTDDGGSTVDPGNEEGDGTVDGDEYGDEYGDYPGDELPGDDVPPDDETPEDTNTQPPTPIDNFQIKCNLEANKTYYVRIKLTNQSDYTGIGHATAPDGNYYSWDTGMDINYKIYMPVSEVSNLRFTGVQTGNTFSGNYSWDGIHNKYQAKLGKNGNVVSNTGSSIHRNAASSIPLYVRYVNSDGDVGPWSEPCYMQFDSGAWSLSGGAKSSTEDGTAFVSNGKIIYMNGSKSEDPRATVLNVNKTVSYYDIEGKSWIFKKNNSYFNELQVLTNRYNTNIFARNLDGKTYFLGALIPNFNYSDIYDSVFHIYDSSTDSFDVTDKRVDADGNNNLVLAAYDNNVIVFGAGSAGRSIIVYDLTYNLISNAHELPERIYKVYSAETINGQVYLLCKENGGYVFEKFDLSDFSFTTVGSVEQSFESGFENTSTVVGNNIYLLEKSSTGFSRKVCKFDTSNNSWSYLPDMLLAKRGARIVSSGNTIYVLGGLTATEGYSTAIESFKVPLQTKRIYLTKDINVPQSIRILGDNIKDFSNKTIKVLFNPNLVTVKSLSPSSSSADNSWRKKVSSSYTYSNISGCCKVKVQNTLSQLESWSGTIDFINASRKVIKDSYVDVIIEEN